MQSCATECRPCSSSASSRPFSVPVPLSSAIFHIEQLAQVADPAPARDRNPRVHSTGKFRSHGPDLSTALSSSSLLILGVALGRDFRNVKPNIRMETPKIQLARRNVFEATLLVAYSLDNQCGLAPLFAATTSEVMSAKHSSAPSPSASLALPLPLLSINPFPLSSRRRPRRNNILLNSTWRQCAVYYSAYLVS